MRFFSLVIPMHHSEETIIKCLDSILSQDFLDYEIVLVDDNTSLETRNLIEEYKDTHTKTKLIYEVVEEITPGYKRNVGLNKAEGEYIWFIDSDDEIENDALRIAYNNICNSDCDILRFSYRNVMENKRLRAETTLKEDVYEGDSLPGFVYNALKNGWSDSLTPWKHIYRKELIKDIGFSSKINDFEDVLFNSFVYPNAKRIKVIGDILYRYYIRNNSVSHKRKHVLQNIVDSYSEIKEYYIKKRFWSLYKNAIISSYGDYFILGAGIKRFGAIYLELRYYDNFNEAQEEIKKIILLKNFQDLISDALNRKLPKELERQYQLLQNGNPEELCKYLMSEPTIIQKHEQIEDKIKFVRDIEIIHVGADTFAIPTGAEGESLVISLDEETAKVFQYLIDTKSISNTLELLYKDYSNENKDEIQENLIDLIHRLKAQNIIC